MTEKSDKELKTICIFGLSSFIGSNLAEFLKKDFKVVGTYHKTKTKIPGIFALPCDVLNKDEVQMVLYTFNPDITIYCCGLTSIVDCSKKEALADALNTSGLFNVSEYCQRYKSQLCYLSSSFVFSGEGKKNIEMDIPDANTVYGKTQAAAEFYIQKTSLNYIIFRCCKIYGRTSGLMKMTFFEQLQEKIVNQQNIACDGTVKTGFIDIYYLAMIIKMCVEQKVVNRLFQISSQDIMDHYSFAKEYCKIFGEPEELITKGKWPFPTLRGSAKNAQSEEIKYRMDLSNIESFLHIKLPTIKESLELTFKRFKGEGKTSKISNKEDGITFI